jgi:localization factor PodJL
VEDSGAAEREPRERYRDPPRRTPDYESEGSWPAGDNDRPHGRRRPNPAPERARDDDWRERPQRERSDRDSERYREATRPPRERREEESWQPKPSRSRPHRELDEDRFEDLAADEGEHYRERYRNPPRLAPEREPENSSWESFSEEDTDRYFAEPSPEADGENEDAERSNFDHERDRAPKRRLSLESEEPFETIPRHPIRERDSATRRYPPEPDYRIEAERSDEDSLSTRRAKAERRPRSRPSADEWGERFSGERDAPMPPRIADSRSSASDAENLPPQRMRIGNREEQRRRRDTRRQRPGPSDDDQWRPEQDPFQHESARAGGSDSDDGAHLGGPYRDLGAAARKPPPDEHRRDGSSHAANPEDNRDAAVDKAIAEITVRQRALDEAAAAEMATRLRRAEIRTGQQPPAPSRIAAQAPPASAQHLVISGLAAGSSQPTASTGIGTRPTPQSGLPADTNAHAESAAAPSPQKAPNDALVAEITARMRALDSEAAVDRQTTQWLEDRRTGADTSAPGCSLVDDVAADILAEKNERHGSTGEGAFSLQPVSPDVLNENGAPAGEEGWKNPAAAAPSVDLGGVERQLRQLTARVEGLRPNGDPNAAITGLRRELLDIGKRFTEALPKHALESLEFEIKTLARRLDESRDSGADSAALAGIERGLAEVREALHGLTPAESLAGLGDAIAALTRKVDAIVAKNDSAALEQLETAIGELRYAVSHVASDEALNKVAEDVRLLSAKVDGFADVAKDDPAALEQLHLAISNLRHAVSRVASDDALSMVAEDVRLLGARIDDLAHNVTNHPLLAQIESRMDALTTAIHASTKANHGAPRELENLLSALVDKLELSQLTQTDHTALTHLEDRIAMLMQRLDASDSRLGLLEGVERGLADLLVYIEQLPANNAGVDSASGKFTDAIEHQFAEIKNSERRTQDSIETVQGTVEHVIDRLAHIESDMRVHRTWSEPAELPGTQAPGLAPALPPAEEPEAPRFEDAAKAAEIEPAANRRGGSRTPIDPNLPPDHPIEPGAAAGRSRRPASPVERLAALESNAAARPPVIPEPPGGKADFIAAARRAAQAAASTSPSEKSSAAPSAPSGGSKKLSERLRTLFVAAAVVAIVVGGFRIVSQMMDHGGPPPAQTQSAPPHVLTEPPQGAPLPLTPSEPMKEPAAPGKGASGANTTSMPKVVAVPASGPETEENHGAAPPPAAAAGAGAAGQSSLLNTPAGGFAVNSGTLPDVAENSASKNVVSAWSAPDVTGSLPPSTASRNSGAPLASDKLPSAIGGPGLRSAAAAGDPAAAYEVGVRFADGRSVPQNNEEAARWLAVAANKGFVPAQFRLGTLYEKGVGVKKDLPEALALYRAAADKGHGKAMHNLAVLYAEGANGTPDYRAAARWFRKAAEEGVTDSQYNLAILYARGVGVEQSFAEAYKWFFLAAKQGDKDAAQKRDEVAGRLDQQKLAAAKAAAEQWTPQPEPAEAVSVKTSESWDAPAKGASVLKTKPHSAAKIPVPDVMKVD